MADVIILLVGFIVMAGLVAAASIALHRIRVKEREGLRQITQKYQEDPLPSWGEQEWAWDHCLNMINSAKNLTELNQVKSDVDYLFDLDEESRK